MLVQSLRMAWESIRSNKMRSFLTMLGIIIGVFSLVVLVSIIDSATGSITDSVSSMGSDSLTVSIMDNKGDPMSLSELNDLAGTGSIDKVSPSVQTQAMVKSGRVEKSAFLTGVAPDYASISAMKLSAGRFLKTPDLDNHTNAAVVSTSVVEDIMKLSDPGKAVGRNVTIGGEAFTVVGVEEPPEDQTASMFGLVQYFVYIPYTTQIRFADMGKDITSFVVSAKDGNLDQAEQDVGEAMLARLKNDKKAFSILNFKSLMKVMDSITGTLSLVMGGVAGISLLVGGIGIMNIMLVSVTERTKEIGIRKAIGADPRNILEQFLIEALMISVLGSLIGILLSWIALRVIGAISAGKNLAMTFGLSPGIVFLAIGFSVGIGLIFGIYPARKAAVKKPIDALRYND